MIYTRGRSKYILFLSASLPVESHLVSSSWAAVHSFYHRCRIQLPKRRACAWHPNIRLWRAVLCCATLNLVRGAWPVVWLTCSAVRDALTRTLEKRVHLASTRTESYCAWGGWMDAGIAARLFAQPLDFAALHFDFGSRLILREWSVAFSG